MTNRQTKLVALLTYPIAAPLGLAVTAAMLFITPVILVIDLILDTDTSLKIGE